MLDVIVPVYKARDTLSDALDSLVAQTKKLFIVTLVQDGDGEDYSDIINEYKRRGLNISLISKEKNEGPGLARQTGIDSNTMCDYLMFLDADDMLTPRAVEILYTEAKKRNADIILSDFYLEKFHEPGVYLKCSETPVTWCHGKIYKAAYLKEKGIRFLPELRLNEDSYFNLVAVACTKEKLRLNELTYIWRANQKSLTRSNGVEGFFRESWEQYLVSQIEGIKSIARISGEVNIKVLAMTLINMYDHHMKSIFLELDDSKIVPRMRELGSETVLKNALNSYEFWEVICEKLKGGTMFGKNLIFYKMRFCDWMKQYIIDNIGDIK